MSLDRFMDPTSIFWIVIGLVIVVPVVCEYWRKMKRDELDASLKADMIARGMSAEEIERVIKARSTTGKS